MSDWYSASITENEVRLWTAKQLPFQLNDEQRKARDRLRGDLETLAQSATGWLDAEYVGPATTGVHADLENVLLYNVGGPALGTLMRQGVRIRRGQEIPKPPDGASFAHYQRYAVVPGFAVPEADGGDRLLASVTDVPLDNVTSLRHVFMQIRTHAEPPTMTRDSRGPLVLDVTITKRVKRGINLQTAIKPVLDGLISAFHTCTPAAADAVQEWLGTAPEDEALVAALHDSRWKVLDERRLVSRRGLQRKDGKPSITWNPADDRCVEVTVRMEQIDPSAPAYQREGDVPTAYSLRATISERS